MLPRSWKRSWIGVAFYVGFCFILGFFPTHGAPHFRYTGSDPSFPVWNLGWPIATMICDPRTGLHVGPFAYALFPMMILLGVVGIGFAVLVRRYQRTTPSQTLH
jgi:hypothetical protein